MKLDPNMWSTHSREARCNLAPSGGEKSPEMRFTCWEALAGIKWKRCLWTPGKNIHLNFMVSVLYLWCILCFFLVELLDPLLWPRFVWSTSAQRRGSKMDSWRGFAPWLVLFSGTATSWDSRRCAGTFWVTRSYQQVSKTCLMYLFSYHSLAMSIYPPVQGHKAFQGYRVIWLF